MPKFASTGKIYLRDVKDRRKAVKQILWGDYLNVVHTEPGWHRVKWGKEQFWIREQDCVDVLPLEVVFLDVGQGDGCLMVTPGENGTQRIMIIDAGVGDNMYRYLRWRFGKYLKQITFHAALATHSDQDHYKGFQKLLDEKNQSFENFYHNGIAERAGDEPLGPTDASGRYLSDIRLTHDEIAKLYSDPTVRGSKQYAKLIQTALTTGRVKRVSALHNEISNGMETRTWMPGFEPGKVDGLSIEVLGPIVERDGDGTAMLRWFGSKDGDDGRDVGKTKNGHSVLLRIAYHGFSLLLGGDLNRPSESFLLRQYGGTSPDRPLSDAVAEASKRFRSDVLKSCHHGGADVTDEFLEAVNPSAFVVSSGDDENYVHPRPDLIGRLGRFGRGKAPLILCTELLRSTREREDRSLLTKLRALSAKIESAATSEATKITLRKERAAVEDKLARRNVEVYGAINLRTDGERLAVAFRMERNKGKDRWHTYWFRHDEVGGFISELEDEH